MLTENEKNIIFTVYKYANERSKNFVSSSIVDTGDFDVKKKEKHSKAQNELGNYLDSLSNDNLKLIKALIYLGRDTTDYDRFDYSGRELFKQQYLFTEKEFNSNRRGNQIASIIDKNQLDKYLAKGLKIMDISS